MIKQAKVLIDDACVGCRFENSSGQCIAYNEDVTTGRCQQCRDSEANTRYNAYSTQTLDGVEAALEQGFTYVQIARELNVNRASIREAVARRRKQREELQRLDAVWHDREQSIPDTEGEAIDRCQHILKSLDAMAVDRIITYLIHWDSHRRRSRRKGGHS